MLHNVHQSALHKLLVCSAVQSRGICVCSDVHFVSDRCGPPGEAHHWPILHGPQAGHEPCDVRSCVLPQHCQYPHLHLRVLVLSRDPETLTPPYTSHRPQPYPSPHPPIFCGTEVGGECEWCVGDGSVSCGILIASSLLAKGREHCFVHRVQGNLCLLGCKYVTLSLIFLSRSRSAWLCGSMPRASCTITAHRHCVSPSSWVTEHELNASRMPITTGSLSWG